MSIHARINWKTSEPVTDKLLDYLTSVVVANRRVKDKKYVYTPDGFVINNDGDKVVFCVCRLIDAWRHLGRPVSWFDTDMPGDSRDQSPALIEAVRTIAKRVVKSETKEK